jgi:branched-chain amino acid transport system substrate-binding protein
MVGVMERQGTPGVKFDVEGSGYGFKVVKVIQAEQAQMPTSCKMVRPD